MPTSRLLLTSLATAALLAHATPAFAKRPSAPRPATPAEGAVVPSAPAMTWGAVKGAKEYEFQFAADRGFGSIVTGGGVRTGNTAATLTKALADGDYFWRVRGIDSAGRAGKWSATRSLVKAWSQAPDLQGPVGGSAVAYPLQPLVLSWNPVRGAVGYLVDVATDASLAASVLGKQVETAATSLALPGTLAPGQVFHWAVTPVDAQGHRGTRSAVGRFSTSWASQTAARVTDLNVDSRLVDPELSWDAVPGAARYDVQVAFDDQFPESSRVCCDKPSLGTSVSPTTLLPNNTYHWRVRAVDVNGNAGAWAVGPSFRKWFDEPDPTVPGLRLRTNDAESVTGTTPVTGHPVLAWDSVAGASGYEVTIVPHDAGCAFNSAAARTTVTPNLAWTPLSRRAPGVNPPYTGRTSEAFYPEPVLVSGNRYCARVRAVAGDLGDREIVSRWTYLRGDGGSSAVTTDGAAFLYQRPDPGASATPHPLATADAYLSPQQGSVSRRTPLLRWRQIPGAIAYWVVVARDESFTTIVDQGYTPVAAYAPRFTMADETTSYYWAVIPVDTTTGAVFTDHYDNAFRAFDKQSVPRTPVAPAGGEVVLGQPRFQWREPEDGGAADGIEYYRLEVARDDKFGDLVDTVKTYATSYTSVNTYPVDTALFWRVRPIASVGADGREVALTESGGQFRRRLTPPILAASNPTGGEAIPVLRWDPVQGAASYDIHVQQADGTTKDFTTAGTAFTPTLWYGTGVWRWQVRANFSGGSGDVTSAYSEPQTFTRRIGALSGARADFSRNRALISWDPSPTAKSYKVEISTTNGFTKIADTQALDGSAWAPNLSKPVYASGGRLFWRVAAVDEGRNVGAFATGQLTLRKRLAVRALGSVRRGKRGSVSVQVTDLGRRPIAGARVTVKGAGVRMSRRSKRRGALLLTLTPRRKGVIVIRATKKGYQSGSARLRVK